MIPFLRRKKEEPVYLDCYTASHFAYNYAKVNNASKFIPEWFKRTDRKTSRFDDGDNVPSIKSCPAFLDYYSKGIVIPLWGEVEIDVHPIGHEGPVYEWRSSNQDFELSANSHFPEQYDKFGGSNLYNVKFTSPWYLKTRELVHFAFSTPVWSQPDTFRGLTGLPGVIQFKHQTATHINYMLEQTEETQKFNFQPLTPMAILHPLTEREVVLRHHLLEGDKIKTVASAGGGMLLNMFQRDLFSNPAKLHARKTAFFQKADELNKCPFK